MATEKHSINLTHHFLIAMPSMVDETFAKSVIYLCEHTKNGALGLVINKPGELKLPSLFAKVDLPLHRADLADAPVYDGGPMHTERGFVLHEQQTAETITFADMKAVPLTPHDGRKPVKSPRKTADDLMVASFEEAVDMTSEIADLDGGNDDDDDTNDSAKDSAPPSFYASSLSIPGGLEMTTSKDVLEALSSGAGPRKVLISLGYSAWGEGQLESELAENAWLTVGADAAVIFDTPVEQRYSKALSLLGLQEWMISPQAGRA